MSGTENTGNSTPAATASSSRSNSTADSYIGSLISLTSKSEIRYEGVLYDINTDTSSIGLKNVRSFGTEGRKKDGSQIPPSDKVYEYILFRGTDIKDLQVKSSPPVQPSPAINNDPAIIQSHYSRPVSTSASLSSSAGGSFPDLSSQNAQMGLPGSSFPGGMPLYQPGGNMGTWGASPPPPNANGGGLAMPMYWQGYYGPPNGLPHMQQQSLVRPPPGMPMPPVQQPIQYPNFNAPLPSGAPNFPASNMPTNFPISNLSTNMTTSNLPVSPAEVPPPLTTSSASLVGSASILPGSAGLTSALLIAPSATLASETLPTLMPNKAPNSALPASNLTASLLSLSPLTTSSPELNAIPPPISNKSYPISDPLKAYPSVVNSSSSVVAPNTLQTDTPTPTPSLITPGQLLQSGPSTVPSSQSVRIAHKDVEVVQVSSVSPRESSIPVSAEVQPPILPLPVPSHTGYKPNGPNFDQHRGRGGYRGRERGRGAGSSRPVTNFTEDFDFMAMNEKFNKDEVWGHLGKSSKSHLKDNEDGKLNDEDVEYEDEEFTENEIKVQSVYNKDDFFDSISCNALDDSRNGRTRFSEQLKIDTETFGEFSRYRGGRGGRGHPRGGRSRGSYYGRGYGYSYSYNRRGRGRASA